MSSETIINQIIEKTFTFGPKLVGAAVLLFGGLWLIKALSGMIGAILDKSKVDVTLKPFLLSLVTILLKVMLGISVLGMVGIEMTSFIAILGAAGLAVGMALSGTLQNFAGGVMLLLFKPFTVGDVIDVGGKIGSVAEIQIFNTIIKTPDNKVIIIPNGGLSNASMINYSTEAQRRVDWSFAVGYGEDIDRVRAVIKKLCDADARILTTPAVLIVVGELSSSSVNFTVRAWVNAADFWGVYFDMNENVYKTFTKEGISMPFPQMDVHVKPVK